MIKRREGWTREKLYKRDEQECVRERERDVGDEQRDV